MIVEQARVSAKVLDATVEGVLEALRRKVGENLLVAASPRQPGADSEIVPVVVRVKDDIAEEMVRDSAAQARAVLFVGSAAPGDELQARLGLTGQPVPLMALVVTHATVDAGDVRRRSGARRVWAVPPGDHRADDKRKRSAMRQIAAAAAEFCTGGLRPGAQVTAAAGVQAGLEWLWDLLGEDGVEEHTIVGGEMMVSERARGEREERDSPAKSSEDLIDKMRHLANFGSDVDAAFDPLHPTLDLQLNAGGRRWRAHGEAFVTSPPFLCLRSNRGGALRLGDLDVADDRLTGLLREAVAGRWRLNTVIAATMNAGKTTLCQALLAECDDGERIDTIEDTPELCLRANGIHQFTFERLTQEANAEGAGEWSAADHIRDAKRANTSKLVIGETRGKGTLAMLDAMSSGLSGCLVTLHSLPGDGVIAKLESYAAAEGAEMSHVRREIFMAVDLLVWMERATDRRRIGSVAQVVGLSEDTGAVVTRELWRRGAADDYAIPVGCPEGAVRDAYLAAGLGGLIDLPGTAPTQDRAPVSLVEG